MNRPFRVVKSATAALSVEGVDVNDTAALSGTIRLYSDRKFHYAVGKVATTDDTPVNADTAEFISSVADHDQISVIAAEGEVDGTIWASQVALG